MAIKRTRLDFEDHFTQIPNAWMRDRRISRRARGLLAEITTHRVGWRITIASLQAGGPEGRDAIRAGVQELIDVGYLIRSQVRDESGRMREIEYELCDPGTADWKPDSGPDQVLSEPTVSSTGSSTGAIEHSTAAWKTDVGSADVGSADVGEPATKKTISSEDQHQEHQGGVTAPAPRTNPTCTKHPHGTLLPCRACGDARRAGDRQRAAETAAADQAAAARRVDRYPGLCPYLQCRDGSCDACISDARSELLVSGARGLDRG